MPVLIFMISHIQRKLVILGLTNAFAVVMKISSFFFSPEISINFLEWIFIQKCKNFNFNDKNTRRWIQSSLRKFLIFGFSDPLAIYVSPFWQSFVLLVCRGKALSEISLKCQKIRSICNQLENARKVFKSPFVVHLLFIHFFGKSLYSGGMALII